MKAETKTSTRIITLFVVIALALTAAFALSGCMSKEQQAEAGLKTILDDYKNGAIDSLDDTDMQEFAAIGLDAEELASLMTEDFSYEIKGSSAGTSSDTVDVEVTIRSKQVTEAVKNSLTSMFSYALGAALTGASEAEMQQQMTQIIMEQLKNETPVENTITVPMVQESGEWVPTTQGEQALTNAVLGDVQALQAEINAAMSNYSL